MDLAISDLDKSLNVSNSWPLFAELTQTKSDMPHACSTRVVSALLKLGMLNAF